MLSTSLLHVQDRTRLEPHLSHRIEEFNRIDQDRLDRMRERLQALGAAEVSTEIAYGVPAEVLLERARAASHAHRDGQPGPRRVPGSRLRRRRQPPGTPGTAAHSVRSAGPLTRKAQPR